MTRPVVVWHRHLGWCWCVGFRWRGWVWPSARYEPLPEAFVVRVLGVVVAVGR